MGSLPLDEGDPAGPVLGAAGIVSVVLGLPVVGGVVVVVSVEEDPGVVKVDDGVVPSGAFSAAHLGSSGVVLQSFLSCFFVKGFSGVVLPVDGSLGVVEDCANP
ncbi:hypothetical protein [Altericista sp. CCNU0014]|uniref:hypothetical protein n=1 Tax=Altericista sp. CCNU0014 TaxID=3082949 RepID=UPI00384C96C2